ncbi:MAG: hypothetical protein EP346_04240 [Bacteroidetes bacterium]|nr:MAG: hypothetical protein EP346_04240 [Bacteroidota bacterium]
MRTLIGIIAIVLSNISIAQNERSLNISVINDGDTLPGAKYYTLSLEVFNADSTSQIIELEFEKKGGKLTPRIILSEETLEALSNSSYVQLNVVHTYAGSIRILSKDTTDCLHYDKQFSIPFNLGFAKTISALVEIVDFCPYQRAGIKVQSDSEEPLDRAYQHFAYQVIGSDSDWQYFYYQGIEKWKRLEYNGER